MGEGIPDLFAEGAAMGTPEISISLFAILLAGHLTATVSRPAVTESGTIFFLGVNI